jgi:hypothetical protein
MIDYDNDLAIILTSLISSASKTGAHSTTFQMCLLID